MSKNIREAIAEKYIEQKLAADAMGIDEPALSRFLKDPKLERIRSKRLNQLKVAFPEYNIEWLLEKSPIKYKDDAHNSFTMPKHRSSGILVNNGNSLGEIPEDEMLMFDEEGNTRFYEISPGVYRMKVPLINETAKAGSLTGFADAEYIEDQEYIVTTVYRYHKGRYKAFRVIGDSMDVDRRTTFVHGDVIIGRELKQELWQSRFHTHKYPFYVFHTKHDGIIFKELVDHNVSEGIVRLHSLNEDKDSYPDFELNLKDVAFIYNVVKREVEI